ncbi:MAG: DUF3784 domain-containing protein [Acholeplasmatales bacterium]|nr:DUF3784 domain-containing protein [Acholeplasmatales bacterium]
MYLVLAIVLFIFSFILLVWGVLSLFNKGFLFNNAYIYANKKEREQMNKKPYYIQTGIVFILLSIASCLEGFNALLKYDVFFVLFIILIVVTLVFAIVSTIYIDKKIINKSE